MRLDFYQQADSNNGVGHFQVPEWGKQKIISIIRLNKKQRQGKNEIKIVALKQ